MLACAVVAAPARAVASARVWEPLVVKGALLQPLLGKAEAHLEVLAVHNRHLVPIPFQVDERLPDGHYALGHGPHPVASDHPGRLGAYDEMALMVSDLGNRADASDGLPKGALEMDVADPLGGRDRYAYIAAVARPVRSPVSYVSYDPVTERIETDNYRLGLTHEFPTDFALQTAMGQHHRNLIRGFQMETRARVFMLVPMHLTEADVSNQVLAYKTGPIRIIREQSHRVRLILKLHSPRVTSYEFLSRDEIDTPFTIYLPWMPNLIFHGIHVRTDMAFRRLSGEQVTWSAPSGGIVRAGTQAAQSALEPALSAAPVKWTAFRAQDFLVMQTFAPTPDLKRLDFRLYYRNAAEELRIGYRIGGWGALASGHHTLDPVVLIAPASYSGQTLSRELEVPPLVRVAPFNPKPLSGQTLSAR